MSDFPTDPPTPRRSSGRRNSDALLRRVVELAHLGWWQTHITSTTDLSQNTTIWSDETYRIFGHEPRSFTPTTENFFAQIPPDEHATIGEAVARAFGGDGDYHIEHRVLRPDGTVRIVEERAVLERDASGQPVRFVGTVLDVTDRRRIEAALKGTDAGARLLAQIVESSQDAIVSAALDGVITTWNPAAERAFGWKASEMIGRPASTFTPTDREFELQECFELIVQGKPKGTYESVRLRRDGSLVDVAISASPIFDADGTTVLGVAAILRDITQQKRIAAQVRHAQRLESVGRLAGGVAHDFNNLLMAITGYAELIRMDLPTDAPQQEDVRALLASAERGARLTRQLLAFGRRQVLNPVPLDVNTVLRDIEGVLRPLTGADVTMRLTLSREPASVRADRAQLEQVVVNLVANARDAMPHGGVLDIETSVTDVGAQQQGAGQPGRYVRLVVKDTGIGMDAETQSRLFEPFFTTKPRGTSTGMGLATTYGIVKQSGGFVTVESTEGAGTTMRIYLPAVDAATRSEPETEVENSETGQTVLVVEDDPAVRSSTRAMLERLRYVVLDAETPTDALALARLHNGPIDVLLTDIMLPEMPGTRLADLVAQLRPEIRVVRMSGFPGTVDLLPDSAARHSFLQKPFSADTLARAIGAALAK
ncbi:MAG: PAS domain S-box protein [Gemmatimonadota bacterium]|nr:PAS domain S-box protein [Gemmatimonadota bacterium]